MTDELNVMVDENELVTTPADEILAETEVSASGPSAGIIAGAAAVGAGIGVLAVEGGKWAYKKIKRRIAIWKAQREAGKAAAQAYDAEQETNKVIDAAKKGVNKK